MCHSCVHLCPEGNFEIGFKFRWSKRKLRTILWVSKGKLGTKMQIITFILGLKSESQIKSYVIQKETWQSGKEIRVPTLEAHMVCQGGNMFNPCGDKQTSRSPITNPKHQPTIAGCIPLKILQQTLQSLGSSSLQNHRPGWLRFQ